MAVDQNDEYTLLYDQISNGEKGKFYRFQLSGLSDGTVISSVMMNELTLIGSNQFASKVSLQQDLPVVGPIIGLKEKVRPIAKLAGGAAYSSSELAETWESSNKPKFSIEFLLLAHSADKAVVHIEWIKKLQGSVLPISGSGGGLLPPLGYKNDGSGTLSLSVGTWFSANRLVMDDVSFTPSKQVMSNGYPLYWNCNITLTPYKMITISDFEGYFKTVNSISADKYAEIVAKDPNFFESFVAKVNKGVTEILG